MAEHLKGTVELHFTFDEEAGGLIGPKWLLDQKIVKPDFCISAGLAYSIVTAHNGVLHLKVTIHGKSAHAAAPDTGHDALQAMTAVLEALYAERKELPGTTSRNIPGIGHPNLTVGLISGGINTNVVPDKVTIRLDRRITPEEDPAQVEAHLRLVIARSVSDFPGIDSEVDRILLASPLRQLPGGGDADRAAPPLRQGDPRRRAESRGRAALHRRAALCRSGHPDGWLRRRPALFPGSQRPPRRREPEALRSHRRHVDRGALR